jgi:hypothetical protein
VCVNIQILCLLQYSDTDRCGEAPDPRFNIYIFFINTFVTAGLGIVIFIVYGTMENNFLYWRDAICGRPKATATAADNNNNDGGVNNNDLDGGDLEDRYRDHSKSISSKKTPGTHRNAPSGVSYVGDRSTAGGGATVAIQLSTAHSTSRLNTAIAGSTNNSISAAPKNSHSSMTSVMPTLSRGVDIPPHSREPPKLDLAVVMPHLSLTSAERGSVTQPSVVAAAAAAAAATTAHNSMSVAASGGSDEAPASTHTDSNASGNADAAPHYRLDRGAPGHTSTASIQLDTAQLG